MASKVRHEQVEHAVTTVGPLINQRGAKTAAVENARCKGINHEEGLGTPVELEVIFEVDR